MPAHIQLAIWIIGGILAILFSILGWSLIQNYTSLIKRVVQLEKDKKELEEKVSSIQNNYNKKFEDVHTCINTTHKEVMDKVSGIQSSIAVLLYALKVENPIKT
jgi:predicted PurR-regulated permease PerM